MKLRLSKGEIKLIGAVALGVGLVCLTLVLVSHYVKETFFQTLEARFRVSGKIDLAERMNPFVIRKKINASPAATAGEIQENSETSTEPSAVQLPAKLEPDGPALQETATQETPPSDTPPPKMSASEARLASETSPATRKADSSFYSLHLASCRKEESCRSIVQKYEDSDIKAFIKRVDLGGKGTWHRVYLGSFETKKQARNARQNYDLPNARIVKTK